MNAKPKYYLRNPEMVTGGEFRCHNCKRMLAKRLVGSVYELELECSRCHAVTRIRCKEPIEFVGEALVAERQNQDARANGVNAS